MLIQRNDNVVRESQSAPGRWIPRFETYNIIRTSAIIYIEGNILFSNLHIDSLSSSCRIALAKFVDEELLLRGTNAVVPIFEVRVEQSSLSLPYVSSWADKNDH